MYLKDVEPNSAVKAEVEEDDRPGGVPHRGVDAAAGQADEMILGQLDVAQGSGGLCPSEHW